MHKGLCAALGLCAMWPCFGGAGGVGAMRSARADETVDKERKDHSMALWATGLARYKLGRWEEAVDLLEQAYEEYPEPDILYNLAQAHRQLKHYEKAVFYYRAYLRDRTDAANRAAIEDIVRKLDVIIEREQASGKEPPQDVKEPPSGWRGAPRGPDGPDRPSPPSAWYADTWGWTFTASGVVALAVGGGFLWNAHDLDGQADDPGVDSLEAGRLRDSADTRRTIGTWTGVGGGALLVAGIVKLAWTESPPRQRDAALVVGYGWIGLSGRF